MLKILRKLQKERPSEQVETPAEWSNPGRPIAWGSSQIYPSSFCQNTLYVKGRALCTHPSQNEVKLDNMNS